MSLNLLLFLLFLSIISTGECGKKKNIDKIIIHVPYKILKHHHTHTKYKIITIPEKKEKTVIYVKALDKEPNTKYTAITHFPESNLEMEIIKKQPKAFYPSQHLSDSSVIHIIKHQEEMEPKDQQQEFSENVLSVKPAQFHMIPQHVDRHENFIPKFTFPSLISHSYEVPQKPVIIQTMLPPPPSPPHIHAHHVPQHQSFNSKVQLKPVIHPQTQIQHYKDNMHLSSNIYKTAITPKLPRSSSYKVREPNQEDHHVQLAKYQPKQLHKKFKVPSLISYNKKPQINFNGDNEFINTNSKTNKIKQDTETEYEHVGYLVIDENSQKIVDKNFNEKFHSWG